MEEVFNGFLIAMTLIAVIVFICLYFVKAGYGIFAGKKWGLAIDNKIGWILMESPVFILMALMWWWSDHKFDPAVLAIFFIFELHYFQRSFIFPFLIKGKSNMPISIISMGVLFNVMNALMQGGWVFYLSGGYELSWLWSPQFIIGTFIFFMGMFINIYSDKLIRSLRKEGDTRHYLPKGGLFNYVTSANYFGEIVEWLGFAILCWSWAGAVFALWTIANLVPRAAAIYSRYNEEFGAEIKNRKLKRIIPFIY